MGEPIIIDGVNVLQCEHYQYKSLKDCEGRLPIAGYCEIGILNDAFDGNLNYERFCIDNPNCFCKQLARKSQECEQKEKEINELHLIIDRLLEASGYDKNISTAEDFEDIYADIDYKLGLLDELKQECEELKERASIAEDNFACEVQARLYHQNEWLKFSKECEELKKQLKTSEKWRINAESLNEKLDIKNIHYRKALEEIEKLVQNVGDADECSYEDKI